MPNLPLELIFNIISKDSPLLHQRLPGNLSRKLVYYAEATSDRPQYQGSSDNHDDIDVLAPNPLPPASSNFRLHLLTALYPPPRRSGRQSIPSPQRSGRHGRGLGRLALCEVPADERFWRAAAGRMGVLEPVVRARPECLDDTCMKSEYFSAFCLLATRENVRFRS